MKNVLKICTVVAVILVFSGAAQADLGQIYTTANSVGTITPYRTLADAQAGSNPVSNPVDVGSHVFSLYLDTTPDASEGFTVLASTYSSWSIGEFQLYYSDAEDAQNDCGTVSIPQMQFQNFDGTYWTEFQATLQGGYKGGVMDWFMRGDHGDGWGQFYEYSLDITCTGLQGTESGGVIAAAGEPADVSGVFSGIFQSQDSWYPPIEHYFYTFEYNLSFDTTHSGIYEGTSYYYFEAVPEPATMGLLGIGAMALLRKCKA